MVLRPAARSRATQPLVLAGAAGLIMGALSQIADGYQYLSEVASRGGLWGAAIFVIATLATNAPSAVRMAFAFALPSLAGYYVMGTVDSGWAPPWATVAFWIVASVSVVPAVAWLAHWSWHSRHIWAFVGIGLLAGGLLAEAYTVAQSDSAYRIMAVLFDSIAGVSIAVVGSARHGRPIGTAVATLGGVVVGIAAIEMVNTLYLWFI